MNPEHQPPMHESGLGEPVRDETSNADDAEAVVLKLLEDFRALQRKTMGFDAMARHSTRGRTWLNEPIRKGMRSLPSQEWVREITRILGGRRPVEAASLQRRYEALAVRCSSPAPSQSPGSPVIEAAAAESQDNRNGSVATGSAGDSNEQGSPRRLRWLHIGLIALLVGSNLTTFWLTRAATPGPSAVDSTATPIRTGENPLGSVCLADAEVAATALRVDKYVLEIIFSARCNAGWSRLTRKDNKAYGNTITVALYERSNPEGPTRQRATESDVQSAFTTVIVRSSPVDRLCAVGSVTLSGRKIVLGDPICT